jgi:UDP-N-acetylglucosamine 2-epimerase
MSDIFFRELGLPEADVNLEVGSGSHGYQTAEIVRRFEPVLQELEPDVLLLYGDTNSTLAAALVGAKCVFARDRRPTLVHVEAGLRAFNRQWPEEHNRVVSDHLSDLLLAPTQTAMDNLAAEGLADRSALVGDVMADAFFWAVQTADGTVPDVVRELRSYALLTMHRGDNVDDDDRLRSWFSALELAGPVVFPVHPRTAATVSRLRDIPPNIVMTDPVGYREMTALERGADYIVTDSGGVQREAYLAGVPCLTLRDETEWVETLEGGWNQLTGSSPSGLRAAIATGVPTPTLERPPIFGSGDAAERIVTVLETRS